MARLKVFRTAAGFHDAYVAATSRKAALAAWGSDADLFARGMAEEVTDEALTEAPLARPGEVIRVSRGSAAEQLAAVERAPRARPKAGKSPAPPAPAPPPPKPKPKPKPSRAPLDEAEAALADARTRHRAETRALAEEQAALDKRKAALAKAQEAEREELDAAVARARTRYDAAVEKWRAG